MRRPRTIGRLAAGLLPLAVVAVSAGPPSPPDAGKARAQTQAPAAGPKYRVVSPKPTDVIAVDLNERGDLAGFEWAEDPKHPGVVEQKPFLFEAGTKAVTYLPLLPTYTATMPAALSDTGVVVGRSGKPAPMGGPRVHLRNQAFVWDAARGIRGLGTLPGDAASFATGVSRDGRRVSGFSVGDDRVRACVWDRKGGDGGRDEWSVTPLPHDGKLGSNVVALSGNGTFAAAVVGTVTSLWSRDDRGVWSRETAAPGKILIPRGVNDEGTVVGLVHSGDGHPHAAVWSRAAGYVAIPEPPGYVRSEAGAVNNRGAVVGMVDGPHGSDVGPDAFVYENGRLRLLTECGPLFTGATAVNDRNEVAGVLEAREDEHAPGADKDKDEAKTEPGKAP